MPLVPFTPVPPGYIYLNSQVNKRKPKSPKANALLMLAPAAKPAAGYETKLRQEMARILGAAKPAKPAKQTAAAAAGYETKLRQEMARILGAAKLRQEMARILGAAKPAKPASVNSFDALDDVVLADRIPKGKKKPKTAKEIAAAGYETKLRQEMARILGAAKPAKPASVKSFDALDDVVLADRIPKGKKKRQQKKKTPKTAKEIAAEIAQARKEIRRLEAVKDRAKIRLVKMGKKPRGSKKRVSIYEKFLQKRR